MAEARRRVHERLRRRRSSTRCDSSARSSCRRCREAAVRGEHRDGGSQQTRAQRAPPAHRPAAARPRPLHLAWIARRRGRRRARRRRVRGRARDVGLRRAHDRRSRAARRASRREVRRALAPELGRSLLRARRRRRSTGASRRSRTSSRSRSTGRSRTRCTSRSRPSAPCSCFARAASSWVVSSRGRVMRKVDDAAPELAAAALAAEGASRSRSGRRCRATTASSPPRRSRRSRRRASTAASGSSRRARTELTLVLALRPADPARRHRRPPAEAHDRPADPAHRRREHELDAGRVRRRQRARAARARHADEALKSKYRLRFRLIETAVFRIDKRDDRPVLCEMEEVLGRPNPAAQA